jgi:acyl dehydratase
MSEKLTFDSINVGDEMPPYVRKYTQEMVNVIMDVIGSVPNWHVDPDQAKNVSDWDIKEDSTALPGVMTEMGISEFMINWLGSPLPWYCGGGLNIKLIAPVQIHVKDGGEITYKGKVTGKKEEDGKKIVECDIYGEHGGGKVMVGTARAVFS